MKKLFLFVILTSLSLQLLSQTGPTVQGKETTRIKEVFNAKTEYIKSVLDLTQKESDVFWPIYNDYTGKLETLSNRKRSCITGINKYLGLQSNMTEKNLKVLLDLNIYYDEQISQLNKSFYMDIQKILSLKKLALFYKAEEDFRVKIIQQLKGSKP
jgi:hypothetical protein